MTCMDCPQLRPFIRPDGTICPDIKRYGICGFHFDRPDCGGPPCPYEELEKILLAKRYDDDFEKFIEETVPLLVATAKGDVDWDNPVIEMEPKKSYAVTARIVEVQVAEPNIVIPNCMKE